MRMRLRGVWVGCVWGGVGQRVGVSAFGVWRLALD
jgi:hypothetical protein